jgi:menaquinone-dependent protoporphyrinogen oxidase
MLRPRILIVYGSSYGQTAKIAASMSSQLQDSGAAVTLARADVLPRAIAPEDFDAVVVGGSVVLGHHQACVEHFVCMHRATLAAMPSAFFSVSGAAASADAAGRAKARRYVDDFARQTGWRPRLTAPIAGAMAYTRYRPLLRWMMKRLSARAGRPTDTSRDHELTDWSQVRRFVAAVAAMVPRPAQARVPVTV